MTSQVTAPNPAAPRVDKRGIPRLWDGGECVILGGGPSIHLLDLSLLAGHRVIAVNMAIAKYPAADVMIFTDPGLPETAGRAFDDFKGLVYSTVIDQKRRDRVRYVPAILDEDGIGRDNTALRRNRSSGGTAISLARHLGVKRIVLVGFDMRRWSAEEVIATFGPVKGQELLSLSHNFHLSYRPDQYHDPYAQKFLLAFPAIARDLAAEGIECVNATPGSSIAEFRIVTPEEALA